MHAAIHHDVDVAVLVTCQDGRLRSNGNSLVVAGLRNLALVPEKHPISFKDPLHLELEDCLIKVDAPMHPGILNQVFELQLRWHYTPPSRSRWIDYSLAVRILTRARSS